MIKICMVFWLAFLTVNGFAKTKEEKAAEKKEARNAKAVCLIKNNLLRGQRLKDCIELEIEKNKKLELKAQKEP